MTILKVLFLVQKSKSTTILLVSHILIPIEYRKRQPATVGDDAVDGSNVGIPSKLLNCTDEVNETEDSEEVPGKKSVFNTSWVMLEQLFLS